MKQTAVTFKTRGASLEGVLTVPDETGAPVPGVVLGHSHPVLGGTMDEPVMIELVMALSRAGVATLRFNFRGMDTHQAEPPKEQIGLDDMLSAAKLMYAWPGIDGKRLALVGYSYGAQVVIQGIRHFKEARAMVLISPPLPSLKGDGKGDGAAPAVSKDRRPRLFLAGGKDRLTSVKALQARVAAFSQQADFVVVPDADHSWRGHETELAEWVTDFLTRVL